MFFFLYCRSVIRLKTIRDILPIIPGMHIMFRRASYSLSDDVEYGYRCNDYISLSNH